ncbi:uncharacterized protein LOC130381844 isoform X3 [Gadus chalcogrammus]|uniref:uncharacterized protein LOC130381844 isoform X3 n=1 Tax=Gadus chalcogrammus TaxID=1042646 RepID=UPI0024C46C9A|nr:uncharacterized protein LOC130381844 isoform X3 [Gadus chalcogrammus]
MGVMKVSNVFTPPQIIMMSWTYVFLPVILGAVVSCQDVLSNPVVEQTVRPGENVTLYCDCKLTTNVNIVWYRNCSHENQPTLSLNWKDRDNGIFEYEENGTNFFHLNILWNASSNSYDLLIKNITDSHLGLYYCGTEELNGEKGNKKEYIYTYGKIITRILFVIPLDAGAGDPAAPDPAAPDPAAPDCGQCWMLLVILCPSSALLLSLLSSLVVYLRCRRKDEDLHVAQTSPSSRDVTSIRNQDEDGLCYATLDIPLCSQRPKKKRVQPSEFSTYSAINTKRM